MKHLKKYAVLIVALLMAVVGAMSVSAEVDDSGWGFNVMQAWIQPNGTVTLLIRGENQTGSQISAAYTFTVNGEQSLRSRNIRNGDSDFFQQEFTPTLPEPGTPIYAQIQMCVDGDCKTQTRRLTDYREGTPGPEISTHYVVSVCRIKFMASQDPDWTLSVFGNQVASGHLDAGQWSDWIDLSEYATEAPMPVNIHWTWENHAPADDSFTLRGCFVTPTPTPEITETPTPSVTPAPLIAHVQADCEGWDVFIDSQPQNTVITIQPAQSGSWENGDSVGITVIAVQENGVEFRVSLQAQKPERCETETPTNTPTATPTGTPTEPPYTPTATATRPANPEHKDCPRIPVTGWPANALVFGRKINEQTGEAWDTTMHPLGVVSNDQTYSMPNVENGLWELYIVTDGQTPIAGASRPQWTVVQTTVSTTGASTEENCEYEQIVSQPGPTAAPFVPYGSCEVNSVTYQRLNNNTVEGWDVSDVIRAVENDGDWMYSNVTTNWGDSVDLHPSQSWDGCWYALERYGEDATAAASLWWSPFGEPNAIIWHGNPVYGHSPDVGPNGEIVFTNSITEGLNPEMLYMTDRFGSFMRPLGVYGNAPEFNHNGSQIWFVGQDGEMRAIDPHGQPMDIHGNRRTARYSVSPAVLLHSDPNTARMFFLGNYTGENLNALTSDNGLVFDIIREAQDLAIQPGENHAFFVYNGEINYAESWFGTGSTWIGDPLHSLSGIAEYSHPDWR